MENPVILPTTKTALQNFLRIWKQDPIAQQTLCIAPLHIFICNPEEPDQITDITIEIEEPNETDKILETSDEQIIQTEPITLEEVLNEAEINWEEPQFADNTEQILKENKNSKNIQKLIDDLTQPLKLTRSQTNPFLASTWQSQLEKIIDRLQENRKSKKGRMGLLEAHYYLGKLLHENILNHNQIQNKLEQTFGERRTRLLWTSAQRQWKLFTTCDKTRIYQNELISITKIMKLKEAEFSILLSSLNL
jgi:hypothetical protein